MKPVRPQLTRRELSAHHRELLLQCYRMVGSLADAEDLVQRIATNACLEELRRRSRRSLPTRFAIPKIASPSSSRRRQGKEATVFPTLRELFGVEPTSFAAVAAPNAAVVRGESPAPRL